jgi:hypothetical protein
MKAHLQVRIESHPFSTGDLIGGDAALDFINTVTGRDQSPRDWLDSYTRLLEWAALVHLLPEKILRALARKAQSEPTAAATALARAVKRGVALNAPRIAASALYGVDAANVQIDDYQFAISLDRHRIGDVGAAPKIGRHLAANPECRVQISTRRLGRLCHARRPRRPGN